MAPPFVPVEAGAAAAASSSADVVTIDLTRHPPRVPLGMLLAGAALSIDPHGSTDLIALAVILTSEVVRRTGGAPLRASKGDTVTLFHKVWGSDSLWRDLHAGRPARDIIGKFQGYARSFAASRQPFLIY